MTELTAPNSTSSGLTRLGRDAHETADALGPLAGLVGTWIGTHGFEMIAVPSHDADFRLIVRPYVEVLTFAALGAPVPNRGDKGVEDLMISGLTYDIRISDLETNEPLHLENGMWLNLGATQDRPIVRMAAIPHGDSVLALGTAETTAEPPAIPDISGLPPDIGHTTRKGYTDAYLGPPFFGSFSPTAPNEVLVAANKGLTFSQTTTLSVSTENGGGVLNIPFVSKNANTTAFAATYWLETITDEKTNSEVLQLQYSQQSNLEFVAKFNAPGLIMWPHINVNTLRKQ